MNKILQINTMQLIALMLLSLNIAPALAAEPMGRLFTSPNERSNLDYLRQTKKNEPLKVDAPVQAAEIAPPVIVVLPDAVSLQGYVKRFDGKPSTVWVNNQSMTENSRNKEVAIGKLNEGSNRVPIKLSANGKRLNLKAGQVYDPQSNRVQEVRNHGAQGDNGTIGESGF